MDEQQMERRRQAAVDGDGRVEETSCACIDATPSTDQRKLQAAAHAQHRWRDLGWRESSVVMVVLS